MIKKQILSYEQDIAADPLNNVWVQANAGTGKTSVLTQRLLRILFRSPDIKRVGVLCLTYTNAAAGEMRNRILSSLRDWALYSDDDLKILLENVVSQKPVNQSDIKHARNIFFTYIDNPDILKIKTIHGFCEEILHRFPIEAGISPAWTLVSDYNQKLLLQDAFNNMINHCADTNTYDAFERILTCVSEYSLSDVLQLLGGRYKDFFDKLNDNDNYRNYFIEKTKDFLKLWDVKTYTFNQENLQNIVSRAQYIQNTTKKPATYIQKIINATRQYIDKTTNFEEYKYLYITKTTGTKTKIGTDPVFLEEQDKVYNFYQYKTNKYIFDNTVALFDLSSAFAKSYFELKQQKNLLDFEDLILYTRRLFSNPATMGWVLSQLDLSLSHILIDEAQDTSPLQWDIVRLLTGDFFVNGDTQNNQRSLFVVGDTKQSIYRFMGANPKAFDESKNLIAQQIHNNSKQLQEVPLTQNFRSLPIILDGVDYLFNSPELTSKINFKNNPHKAFRDDKTGKIILNKPTIQGISEKTNKDFIQDIAKNIQTLITKGTKPGDIMVLVQQRYPFAPLLTHALERLHIEVAGADKIDLPKFPAIRDLMNVIRFCLNNNDDYSLCCVLKSPLYRLNERDIFKLCKIKNGRRKADKSNSVQGTIFNILKEQYPEIHKDLEETIEASKGMAPYSFFSYLLSKKNNRQSMIAALGNQIIMPLEEFMTICLAYERTQAGTLKHFIKWFITGGSEVKRDLDATSGVKIVTVHGSKGLEAPVVFLIDTVRTPETPKILHIPTPNISNYPDCWLWIAGNTDVSELRSQAEEIVKQDDYDEYYRLLYVAMTRARDELHIYGFTPFTKIPELSWFNILEKVFNKQISTFTEEVE